MTTKTVRHPRFDETREVPAGDVDKWVRAGWVDVTPARAPKPKRRRKPPKKD